MGMRWLAALAWMVASASPAFADTAGERATLMGLAGVFVKVEDMQTVVEREGLSQFALQREVEQQVRGAGIRALGPTEWLGMSGQPQLGLTVVLGASEALPGQYMYGILVTLKQLVVLARDNAKRTHAVTWSAPGEFGTAPPATIRRSVSGQVKQFIDAFLAMNPKR